MQGIWRQVLWVLHCTHTIPALLYHQQHSCWENIVFLLPVYVLHLEYHMHKQGVFKGGNWACTEERGGKGFLFSLSMGLLLPPFSFAGGGLPSNPTSFPQGGADTTAGKKREEKGVFCSPPPRTTINMSLSKMRRRRKEGRGGKKERRRGNRGLLTPGRTCLS